MTRSRKKNPVYVCSKPRDEEHRRRERRRVRQALNTDIDSEVPYLDSKELGRDEWGTWFVFDLDAEEEKLARRK